MKNSLLFLFFFLPLILIGQSQIVSDQTVFSKSLEREVAYNVYLPSGYEDSSDQFPVIYLLHGYTGNHTDWVNKGAMQTFMDVAIANGTLDPAVVVMPDGGNLWYINAYDGSSNYEDFFIDELIPFIEEEYKVSSDREDRYITGLSMGGYGSLHLAMNHPEVFSGVSSLSGALITEDMWKVNDISRFDPSAEVMWGVKEDRVLTDHWRKYNPIDVIENLQNREDSLQLKMYFDCGDDDFLTIGNALFHIALTEKQIPHEYRVRDGGHTWEYWITGLIDGLESITRD